MNESDHIPFVIDIKKVIDILAKQIYQSSLALLRENCQNAYDAVLQRMYLNQKFEPFIKIKIEPSEISIEDNGIGMTKEEMKKHFWHAGSSGKNTTDALAAGVVGTFGIGAMANFGVADKLVVTSESATKSERTISSAKREDLSATKDCIELRKVDPIGNPGTTIKATISEGSHINVDEATKYIKNIIRNINIPVYINDSLSSQEDFSSRVPEIKAGWRYQKSEYQISDDIKADVHLVIAKTGEVWIKLEKIFYQNGSLKGEMILRQNLQQIQTFRSNFALALTGVNSAYAFGGIANLSIFRPTAGREALTSSSMQILQSIMTSIENFVSLNIANTEYANMNTNFMDWISRNKRYDLCSNLKIRKEPGNIQVSLESIKSQGEEQPFNYFEGTEKSIINQFASEDQPLIIVSTRQPRRRCEIEYITRFCNGNRIEDTPSVTKLKERNDWSLDESAISFRIINILEQDYFLKCEVDFGMISHGLSIHVAFDSVPYKIVLNARSSTVALLLESYKSDISLMPILIKDFVRSVIFPKISSKVPSSTKEGAEAFLKRIRRPKDIFEYEQDDLGNLSDIWQKYLEGKFSLRDAAQKSVTYVQRNVQIVDSANTSNISQVLPDVVENQRLIQSLSKEPDYDPLPSISRIEIESKAKLLLINETEPPLKGYRCFLALTDRVRKERMEFFLQPHRTEVVWGGQKAMFIFPHHSEEFALYYELQGNEIFSEESGGGKFPTCTIVLKNQIYLPIPNVIKENFIPSGNGRKRFEIQCDLLYPDLRSSV